MAPFPNPPSGRLTATQAAVRLGVSRERVIRMVQTGEIPGERDPRHGWLVDQAVVRVLAKQQKGGRRGH